MRGTPERPRCLAVSLWVFVLLVGLAFRHLPRGISGGDPGDLQMACATFGIAHPPGYLGFAGVGWLAIQILPFLDPALVVSLGCLLSMAGGLAILTWILARSGMHPSIAAMLGLSPFFLDLVWLNMIEAEVYAPAFFTLTVATVSFLRFLQRGTGLWLWVAAASLGFLAANRPPALLYLAGWIPALLLAERAPKVAGTLTGSRVWRASAVFTGSLALILVLTVARDSPQAPYNYVQAYSEVFPELPEVEDGFSARMVRLWWLISGKQFRHLFEFDPAQLGDEASNLAVRFGFTEQGLFVALIVLGALLVALAWRRSPPNALVALGIGGGMLAFLAYFQVSGPTANRLPALVAGAVALATACGPRLQFSSPRGSGLCWGALLGTSVAVVVFGGQRSSEVSFRRHPLELSDARPFLETLRFQDLPPRAILLCEWNHRAPLEYARIVQSGRLDVKIVTADRDRWLRLAQQGVATGPVFFTERVELPEGWSYAPWRNLWQPVRPGIIEPVRAPDASG